MSDVGPANKAPAHVIVVPAKRHSELAAHLRETLGIVVVGGVGETRHGHLSTVVKKAGQPFAVLEGVEVTNDMSRPPKPFRKVVNDCPFCEQTIPQADAHSCTALVVYKEGWDETQPDGPVLAFRPHGLSAKQLGDMDAIVRQVK